MSAVKRDIDKARSLKLSAHWLVDRHAHVLGGIRFVELRERLAKAEAEVAAVREALAV